MTVYAYNYPQVARILYKQSGFVSIATLVVSCVSSEHFLQCPTCILVMTDVE